MKILVTGANGQLGYDVIKELMNRGIECMGTLRTDFDITDFAATREYITDYSPDVVIHCAAYTAVDKAEDEIETCMLVNYKATENIAAVCKTIDAKMIYISTDYVFPGSGSNFHEVDDFARPLGIYGQTKFDGENAVKRWIDKYFIVRISWVFGLNGRNFVKTMLRLGSEMPELKVVGDQMGSPTYTVDLAKLLVDMAMTEKYGIYHATNEGVCSWAEFAAEIFRLMDMPVKVKPILSEEYQTRALRPLNSRLSKASLDKNGFSRLPDWHDALARYIEELKLNR